MGITFSDYLSHDFFFFVYCNCVNVSETNKRSLSLSHGFFGSDFGLRDTFLERIAPKSIDIDKDKLHIKYKHISRYHY